MDPNESPSLLQQTKQTDVHGNFLLITRCGWVLLGNLWMCGWLWFRHAGGRPLHRLAADSAFYSCGYWYRWIFADQLSQNVVNLFVWLIYDIPTKKDQMARNSDELIWIASLPAQCYNSGNAINLLSPVRYMHYWNRTFVALQDPDESSTLYIDHGITQLVIYIVYPMFAIFVAKRIAVNWCADILRPVPVMLYCCNGSTTPPLWTLFNITLHEWWWMISFFPGEANHHSPMWFLAHKHVQQMCTTRCRMPLCFVVLLMLHRKAWLIRIA